MYFVLVSAWSRCVLFEFVLVFGLVADSFAVFFGFVNFVLVSAALAAICLVLYGFCVMCHATLPSTTCFRIKHKLTA